MSILERLAMVGRAVGARVDGWYNNVTGLGTARDKSSFTAWGQAWLIQDQELESLFEGNDMAARIVEKIVDDALRVPPDLHVDSGEDDDESVEEVQRVQAAIRVAMDDLGAIEKLSEAAVWGRLYGGGAVWVNTDDPGAADPESPLDPASIRRVRSLLVLDKRDLYPIAWETDPSKPSFDEPSVYQVTTVSANGTTIPLRRVHASRLIVFGGQRTSMRRRLMNNGWSTSVLQRPHEVLKQHGQTWQAVAHIMQDGAQGVFKMKGLFEAVASNKPELIAGRVQAMDMARSVTRAVLLDADANESFERKDMALTGLAAMTDKFALRLAAAADMPMTVLMGISPGGLNATGESDRGLWDERVQAYQTHVLRRRFEQLMRLILLSKEGPTSGKEPDGWCVKFPPLRQMTPVETATMRKIVAETDAIHIQNQIATPEEVGQSRFPKSGYSMETRIDLELRRKIAEADAERAIEAAENPPEPKDPEAPPGDEPAIEDDDKGVDDKPEET